MNKTLTLAMLAAILAAACSKDGGGAPAAAAPQPSQSSQPPSAQAAPLAIKGRRIDVKASKSGYEPATVEVKTGEDVTLVFTLVEKGTCAAEVVIPALGFQKKLQLGEPVAVAYRAEKAGEVPFACGMGMYTGKIVAKD